MTPSCHHSVTFINYGPTRTNETLPGPQLSKWRLPGTADGLAFRAGWVFIFLPRSQGKRVRVQESLSRGARLPSLPKCLPCGAGRRISHCTAPHTHLTQLWKALGGSGRLLASRWGHREVPCMKGVYNPLANRQESRPGLHRGFPGQIQLLSRGLNKTSLGFGGVNLNALRRPMSPAPSGSPALLGSVTPLRQI